MSIDIRSLATTIFPPETELPRFPLRRRAPLPALLRTDAELAVLDVSKFFGDTTGGVRTYLLEKASYVERHPWFRQTLLLPGPWDSLTQSSGVRVYRIRGPRIPTQDPYRFVLRPRVVARLIEHEGPDIIEMGSPYLLPWMVRRVAKRLQLPMVWYYHANFPRLMVPQVEDAALPARLATAAAWRYVRALGVRMDLTIAGSEFVAADLRWAGVPRVAVVPLGVDTEHFHPGRRVRTAETRRRLGLPDEPLAAYLGRFAREKEIDVAIRGWDVVRKATGARLVLVGDGPGARRLRALPGADEVIWLPYIGDRDLVADFLATLNIYLAPGPFETFGLSAAEALSCGTPVLSVDHGAVPEQIHACGAGALYRRGDANDLARAAIALLRGEHGDLQTLGARARRYTEQHRSWDTVFDRLFELYRSEI